MKTWGDNIIACPLHLQTWGTCPLLPLCSARRHCTHEDAHIHMHARRVAACVFVLNYGLHLSCVSCIVYIVFYIGLYNIIKTVWMTFYVLYCILHYVNNNNNNKCKFIPPLLTSCIVCINKLMINK